MKQNESDQLYELYTLYKKGLINEQEFADLKSKLQHDVTPNVQHGNAKQSEHSQNIGSDDFKHYIKIFLVTVVVGLVGLGAFVIIQNRHRIFGHSHLDDYRHKSSIFSSLKDSSPSANTAVIPQQDITIENLSTEHGVFVDGLKGMRMHFKIEVNNHQNDSLQFIVFFYKGSDKADGKLIGGEYKVNKYRSVDNQVCVWTNTTILYEASVWKDISLFIPTDAIGTGLSTGKHEISAQLQIRDVNDGYNVLAKSDVINYTITWTQRRKTSPTSRFIKPICKMNFSH